MIFYDFEVFKFDWLITAIDPEKRLTHRIWNDRESFTAFCEDHKYDIWVGCNNAHYDQYIKKAILCDLNPKAVNDWIIVDNLPGWQFSQLFNKFKFIEYDVLTRIDRGLKVWEGFLGNRIKESSIPFNIQRRLTDEEKAETEKYCETDVLNTIEVFLNKKNDFDAIMGLISMFPETLSIWDVGRTKAQISAKILECHKVKRDDEFDLSVLPCIRIDKYKYAAEWYMRFRNHPSTDAKDIYSQKLKMMIAGLEHSISWGGIHAGKTQYHNSGVKQGRQIWHVDVASFYPRLMIFHNLLTRNSRKPEKFKQIYDKRIQLKHEGKKAEQAPLKIVINGTFGISKSDTSDAYDPRNANLICLNGQLMLIDLIEHLETIPGFELIQSNTDGLIISLPDTDVAFNRMDDICYEWETRCNMALEFDEITEIYQKDVNNYVFRFSNGKIERKGAYVKELGALDYDLPIVNKALVDFMMNHVPVERTILNCDDLKEFQQIKKIGQMYEYIVHGQKRIPERVIRCFASKKPSDGGLFMKHNKKTKLDKIAGTPEHAFLWNDSVAGVKCPDQLNKQWYINLALERLDDFGVLGNDR